MPGTIVDTVVNALGNTAATFDPDQPRGRLTGLLSLDPVRTYYAADQVGFTPTEFDINQATGAFTITVPANSELNPPTSAYVLQVLRNGKLLFTTPRFVVPPGSVSDLGTLVVLTGEELDLATKTTFSDESYEAVPTDRYIAQVGTMTDTRVVTLPLATSVPAGAEIVIADESGSVGPYTGTAAHEIVIVGDGTDVVKNAYFPAADSDRITQAYDSRRLRSNNVNGWIVTEHGSRRPVLWYSRTRDLAIPSGVWIPHAWNRNYLDNTDDYQNLAATTTTIAAGSNGAVLPQGTINVASTALFKTSGWIEVRTVDDSPGPGLGTVARYTGKTATSFTGCNTAPWVGISTGTMATGMLVEQAYVGIENAASYLYFTVFGASFSANATGYRAIRFAADFFGGVASFADGQDVPALNIANQHLQVTMQPAAGTGTAPQYLQVFQNSGTVLRSTVDGLTTPIIMQGHLSAF